MGKNFARLKESLSRIKGILSRIIPTLIKKNAIAWASYKWYRIIVRTLITSANTMNTILGFCAAVYAIMLITDGTLSVSHPLVTVWLTIFGLLLTVAGGMWYTYEDITDIEAIMETKPPDETT